MKNPTILAAEDEETDFQLIQMAIKEIQGSIQLHRVINGEEAISFLERSGTFNTAPRPDLVLLNGTMPKKSGFEVLDYMKRQEVLRSIPVVILTSAVSSRDKERAQALGADRFINKATGWQPFYEALRDVCSRYCHFVSRETEAPTV